MLLLLWQSSMLQIFFYFSTPTPLSELSPRTLGTVWEGWDHCQPVLMAPLPSQVQGPQSRPPLAPSPLGLYASVTVESSPKALVWQYCAHMFLVIKWPELSGEMSRGISWRPQLLSFPPHRHILWKLWELENCSSSFNQGHYLRCLSTTLFLNGQFYIKEKGKSIAAMYSISDWISFSCHNM